MRRRKICNILCKEVRLKRESGREEMEREKREIIQNNNNYTHIMCLCVSFIL